MMSKLEETFLAASVNYNYESNSLSLTDMPETTDLGSNFIASDWWWPNYERTIIREYYPTYWPTTTIQKSKLEQAFKIVTKLMEKKIIKGDLTVKKFVTLVNDVSEII